MMIMYKKTIVILLITSIVALANLYSYEDQSKEGQKGPMVNHGHWLDSNIVIAKMNYDSLWNNAIAIENSTDGQRLIENCIQSYGGREHLGKINTLKLEYLSNLSLSKKIQMVTKYFQIGQKHKIVITEDGIPVMVRIINNNAGWITTPEGTKTIEDVHYKRDLIAYLSLTMPLGMETESFSGKRYGKRDNDSLEYIYLKNDDMFIMILGIDPNDFMIKNIEGVVIQEDSRLVYIERYSDFRDTDGFILPYRKKYISMGLEVSNSILNSFEVNPSFNDNIFNAPTE
jgi:hypothetical protein